MKDSFVTGAERVAAWADLLDAINVFPVADGDTGAIYRLVFTPARGGRGQKKVVEQLLFPHAATPAISPPGFFVFYMADSIADLAGKAQEGRKGA